MYKSKQYRASCVPCNARVYKQHRLCCVTRWRSVCNPFSTITRRWPLSAVSKGKYMCTARKTCLCICMGEWVCSSWHCEQQSCDLSSCSPALRLPMCLPVTCPPPMLVAFLRNVVIDNTKTTSAVSRSSWQHCRLLFGTFAPKSRP